MLKQQEADLNSLIDLERKSHVSKHTWRSWIRQGKLAHVRLGRRILVEEQDFRKFIAAGRVEAK